MGAAHPTLSKWLRATANQDPRSNLLRLVDRRDSEPNKEEVSVVAKRSPCAERAEEAQKARLMALPPIERMKKALRAGRTARVFAALGAQSRGGKR